MKKLCARLARYLEKYREQIAYLFFGGVTTVENIVVYGVLAHLGVSTAVANAAAWAICVLTAYITNRLWVFRSASKGAAAAKELGAFVACRVGTGVLDEAIMVLGVDRLGLWNLGVKVFANVLVIVLNYVFSKWIIFRRGGATGTDGGAAASKKHHNVGG